MYNFAYKSYYLLPITYYLLHVITLLCPKVLLLITFYFTYYLLLTSTYYISLHITYYSIFLLANGGSNLLLPKVPHNTGTVPGEFALLSLGTD